MKLFISALSDCVCNWYKIQANLPEQNGFIVVMDARDGQLIVVHHHLNNNRMSGNPRWILMFRFICEVGSWHYASHLRNMVTIMT